MPFKTLHLPFKLRLWNTFFCIMCIFKLSTGFNLNTDACQIESMAVATTKYHIVLCSIVHKRNNIWKLIQLKWFVEKWIQLDSNRFSQYGGNTFFGRFLYLDCFVLSYYYFCLFPHHFASTKLQRYEWEKWCCKQRKMCISTMFNLFMCVYLCFDVHDAARFSSLLNRIEAHLPYHGLQNRFNSARNSIRLDITWESMWKKMHKSQQLPLLNVSMCEAQWNIICGNVKKIHHFRNEKK